MGFAASPGAYSTGQSGALSNRQNTACVNYTSGYIMKTMPKLSEREKEVAKLSHKSNAEIAQALNITPGTVKAHINSIYGKLGLLGTPAPRSALVLMAERREI
jgi:DNA-binding NarL/FixJ family response regulator